MQKKYPFDEKALYFSIGSGQRRYNENIIAKRLGFKSENTSPSSYPDYKELFLIKGVDNKIYHDRPTKPNQAYLETPLEFAGFNNPLIKHNILCPRYNIYLLQFLGILKEINFMDYTLEPVWVYFLNNGDDLHLRYNEIVQRFEPRKDLYAYLHLTNERIDISALKAAGLLESYKFPAFFGTTIEPFTLNCNPITARKIEEMNLRLVCYEYPRTRLVYEEPKRKVTWRTENGFVYRRKYSR